MLNKLINRLKSLFPGRQLGAYALVGAWNTLFGYGLYAALVWGLDGKLKFAYMWANVLSNFIAITQAFFLYKFFVFKLQFIKMKAILTKTPKNGNRTITLIW